jgi:hypothetical protein
LPVSNRARQVSKLPNKFRHGCLSIRLCRLSIVLRHSDAGRSRKDERNFEAIYGSLSAPEPRRTTSPGRISSLGSPQPCVQPHGFLPLFRMLGFSIAVVLISLQGLALWTVNLLNPLFLENVLHYDAWRAGLAVAPRGLGVSAVGYAAH